MAKIAANRIKATTVITATGDVTATGTVNGYRRLSDIPGINAGDTFDYLIFAGADWEIGEGVYATTPNTFVRQTVYDSTNAGNRVSFASGTKVVAVVQPAQKALLTDLIATITAQWTLTAPIVLGGLTIQGNTTAYSTDADAGLGPEFMLARRSGSPAVDDLLGRYGISWWGTATSPSDVLAAALYAKALDTTTGSMDAKAVLGALVAGSFADVLHLHDGVVVGTTSGGFPGEGKINAKGYLVNGADLLAATIPVMLSTETGALSTVTQIIPDDDTIPQNTEGLQLLSKSITPRKAGNIISVRALVNMSTRSNGVGIAALFRDSVANALAAGRHGDSEASQDYGQVLLEYSMLATSTDTIEFKLRVGQSIAGGLIINGDGDGTRRFGGVCLSSLRVSEYYAT